jgi:hypothetical protein
MIYSEMIALYSLLKSLYVDFNFIQTGYTMKNHFSFLCILFLMAIFLFNFQAATHCFATQRSQTFDAGNSFSSPDQGYFSLMPEKTTSGENYGWYTAPVTNFYRKDLVKTRAPWLRDGVTGKKLAFYAPLSAGKWWISMFFEAGLEDSSTIAISFDGKPIETEMTSFSPPAEGHDSIQDIYRVVQAPVTIMNDGVQIGMVGKQDSVRLLGIRVYPQPVIKTDKHREIMNELKSLGSYPQVKSLDSLTVGLDALLAQLIQLGDQYPDDSFYSYWHEHVSLLLKAEHYIKLMGWEWATKETGLGIFDRFHGAAMILDGLLMNKDPEQYPLYERAIWQRGRVLYWLDRERGSGREIRRAIKDLNWLAQRYPSDTLLAMYTGEKIEHRSGCLNNEILFEAPQWAVVQRNALCRLSEVIYWWVSERQAENGEFGGKLGDDVELLRAFPPLVLSGDTLAQKGWKKLAEAVYKSDKVYKGYSAEPIDVEHAAEFISDTAPELVLFSDDSLYINRLYASAAHFDTLWTGINDKGLRYFKSSWFGSTSIRTEPPRNRDVEMNARATKALRFLAWKTGDPNVIDLLHQWSKAWLNAALRTDKGKPKGIFPASVRFEDGAFNGDEPTWHIANMYWRYYDWRHGAGASLLDQLWFTYTLTLDPELLQPLYLSLEQIQEHVDQDQSLDPRDHEPGSKAWAFATLANKAKFWQVVERWRFSTDDDRYDNLILVMGTPYAKFRLTGNEKELVNGLQKVLNNVRYNYPLLTDQVLHTDRVYPDGESADLGTAHLKAMLTGNGIYANSSPYEAVTWEDTHPDFTALVRDASKEALHVELYSFADSEQTLTMRVWQLDKGDYKMHITNPQKRSKSVTVQQTGQRIQIDLKPQTLTSIKFVP